MKILITGCAGFIGYNLSKRLLENQHTVIGVDNLNDDEGAATIKISRINELKVFGGFEFIKLDVVNDAFTSILKEQTVDITIHLAAKDIYYESNDVIRYTPYLITNVVGTSKIFELSRALNSKKFIYASTFSVYGAVKKQSLTEKKILPKPISPHGASKLAAEQIVHFMHNYYKIPSVILRIFSVYGPQMKTHTMIPLIIDRLNKNLPIDFYHDSDATRDFIYIDDVVEAIISTFDKRLKYQAINIASGKSSTMREIALMIADIMKKDKSLVRFTQHQKDNRTIVVKHSHADISRAKKLLRFEPKTNLKAGLEKTVEWYMNHPDILKLSTHQNA